MVAPTRVNEGAPQEPVTAEPADTATAGVTQAEVVTEDLARAAADLEETAPAAVAVAVAEPAGSAAMKQVPATEPVPAEVVPAQAGPAEAEPAKAELAEPERAEAKDAEAEPVAAENAGVGAAEAELTSAELSGTGPAAADEPELAAGRESRAGEAEKAAGTREAGEAQEVAEAREASRDVGPLAVVGIIVGVIALVGVAAGVLAMVTHGFKPKTVVTYRPAAVFGLRPGQCVNAGSNSLSFSLVSCASPHDAEVFARFSLPAAAWPGSAAVRQQASDGCASRLSGYLNPQLASIGLSQEYVYPNRDAWAANQRTVVCEVSSGNGRLTGSVRAKT